MLPFEKIEMPISIRSLINLFFISPLSLNPNHLFYPLLSNSISISEQRILKAKSKWCPIPMFLSHLITSFFKAWAASSSDLHTLTPTPFSLIVPMASSFMISSTLMMKMTPRRMACLPCSPGIVLGRRNIVFSAIKTGWNLWTGPFGPINRSGCIEKK